jgi:cytochrome c peroxidase
MTSRRSHLAASVLGVALAACGAQGRDATQTPGSGGAAGAGAGRDDAGSTAGSGGSAGSTVSSGGSVGAMAGGAPATDSGAPLVDPCDDPSAAMCALARSMKLPDVLPPARGNKYGDSDDAAMLGFSLFFDNRLGNGTGCAECHAPEFAFTDHKSVSTGKGTGTRNAPTVFNAGRLKVIFWDGRADSLWSQPLFAIENPLEMASSRLELAHLIDGDAALHAAYEPVFGKLPDMSSWPATGKPGDTAFDSLSADTQTEVNRVAANVGKALEAYMRKNSTGGSTLDAYLGGDSSAFIDAAKLGLKAFIAAKCTDCHSGSMLTDETFHDVGFPGLPDAGTDPGRPGGIPVLDANIFNLAGVFADPDTGATPPVTKDDAPAGAFRTPSLRNVTRTAPYGHSGALATLNDVLSLHAPNVSEEDRGNIIAFFQTLNGDYPPRPWSNWPSPQ